MINTRLPVEDSVLDSIFQAIHLHVAEDTNGKPYAEREELNALEEQVVEATGNLKLANALGAAAFGVAYETARELFIWGWRLRGNPDLLATLPKDES
jgi:hypothetical protein